MIFNDFDPVDSECHVKILDC